MEADEFRELVNQHADSVRAFVWRRGGGLDEAVSGPEDICAEVWSIAWQRRSSAPELTEVGASKAWVLQIARHVLANHIRKTVTRRGISSTFRQEELTTASAESMVIDDANIREIFGVLSAGEKEVMALTIWEGLKPAEIAAVIGASANSVSIKLHKARAKISAHLESVENSMERNPDPATPSQ